jgi:rubrerythrin
MNLFLLHPFHLDYNMQKRGEKDDNIKWIYECEVCGNIFKSGTDEDYQIFKLHMKRYHKIDYRAEWEKFDKDHVYVCKVCKQVFSCGNKYDLNKTYEDMFIDHMEQKHNLFGQDPEKLKKEYKNKEIKIIPAFPIRCPDCLKWFSPEEYNNGTYEGHLSKEHGVDLKKKSSS